MIERNVTSRSREHEEELRSRTRRACGALSSLKSTVAAVVPVTSAVTRNAPSIRDHRGRRQGLLRPSRCRCPAARSDCRHPLCCRAAPICRLDHLSRGDGRAASRRRVVHSLILDVLRVYRDDSKKLLPTNCALPNAVMMRSCVRVTEACVVAEAEPACVEQGGDGHQERRRRSRQSRPPKHALEHAPDLCHPAFREG